MDIRLHGPEWEVQNFGDFLIGTSFYVAKQNAGPVLRPEGSDGGFDGATELLGFDRLEG
jgi:hypothetical protein